MTITWETAKAMMDGIAYALCRTICHGEEFDNLSKGQLVDYVNNTARKLFMDHCDEKGITKVEVEEE